VPVSPAATRAYGNAQDRCPSVHAPFLELDGALVRVRVPGGILTGHAAHAIAAAIGRVGGGPVEVTNRANLQLRGIAPESVPEVCHALVAVGVAAADPAADERRNVLASPTAGVDKAELLDTSSLVAAIAERLASEAACGLSPKFGVLVDGGGAVHVRGRAHDVALGAVRGQDGAVRYEVRLGEALPIALRPSEPVWTIEPARALDVIDTMIEVCRSFGRARELLETLGVTRAWDEIARRARGALTLVRGRDIAASSAASESPVGVRPQRAPGLVSVGAVAMLGRLDAEELAAVADVALATRGAGLRVSPWRSVVVTNVPTRDAAAVATRLERAGLVTDPDHPANVVVACAGKRGCAAGFVDAPADARALIDRLAARPVGERPRSVHVSGCDKGCARPAPAEWTIVGGPRPEIYTLYRDTARTSTVHADGFVEGSRFGTEVQSGIDARAALDRMAGETSAP
jgi:precorrin-3B synthase